MDYLGERVTTDPSPLADLQPAAIVSLTPWPAPDFDDLGLTARPRRVRGPAGGWQATSPPGTSVWQEAIDGIESSVHPLAAVDGPVAVFASTALSVGALLGMRLAKLTAPRRFWHFDGHTWRRTGAARNHGRVMLRSSAPSRLHDGPPIAILVEVGQPIEPKAVPLDLDTALQLITLSAPSIGSQPRVAQQIAFDLAHMFEHVRRRAPFSTVHLVYAGPLVVLMMAAHALMGLRNVIVYERLGKPPRFRGALQFQSGRASLVPAR